MTNIAKLKAENGNSAVKCVSNPLPYLFNA